MKLKFYVLTSENLEALQRHTSVEYSNIPKDQIVVVVNTLNKAYEKEVKDYCKSERILYHISDSNGTPAKGKNAVFDVFLESDNDYCVLIDGDDFLTQHGVWMYQHLADLETPPDAVCLVQQASFRNFEGGTALVQPFTADYDALFKVDYYDIFKNNAGLSHEKSVYFESLHTKYYSQQQKYSEGSEVHCRVTWFSREAAKFRFDESLRIGEDTLQMLRLKHEAVKGRLSFYSTDERPATYIYDERTYGIVMRESKKGNDFNWMDDYLVALGKMEIQGRLHADVLLPELKINYPQNYTYDVLSSETSYIHTLDDCELMFPKNATEESLSNAHTYLKERYVQKAA
tara:strand:- start:1476 stop:2507 length:1032 start_codon:yes stop_codon:yes gene_type:complete